MMCRNITKLHAAASLACLVSFLALTGAVAAQGSSQELGEVVWPGDGHRGSDELAGLGESLFEEGTDPMVIGERPIASFHLERINDSATRILVGEEGGENHSFVQHHEPAPSGPHANVGIQPGDLRPTVEVRPDVEDHRRVLGLSGPPGSFGLDGDSVEERIEDFADQIGFPLVERYLNASGTYPDLFARERGCLEAADDRCSVTADFSIDCPDCRLTSFLGPDADSPLEGGYERVGIDGARKRS